MTERLRESLSAWIDGELGRDEERFLGRALEADAELRETLARWTLVGDCLRGARVAPVGPQFARTLATRIEREPAPASVWARARRRLVRPVAGGAIAASVAVLALTIGGPGRDPATPPAAVVDAAAPAIPVLASQAPLRTEDLAPVLPLRQVSETWALPLAPATAPMSIERVDPSVERYFLQHSVGASASARAGFVPYVHLVAWPAARPAPATLPPGSGR